MKNLFRRMILRYRIAHLSAQVSNLAAARAVALQDQFRRERILTAMQRELDRLDGVKRPPCHIDESIVQTCQRAK